ncbi:hypothetical protein [Agromyces humi]|uniref:hypothetical protein n=1 Tax=Agromyces humi TaxID=1766800 RepID=UPI00135A45AA|nr:hypothetical protein [Agromyces humi]
MTAVEGEIDSALSRAGADQGHQAFQEFLLAGERYTVGDLARNGAEKRFAAFFNNLPKDQQTSIHGYFRRQSLLDLSQRVAVLGPYTKIPISTPLDRASFRALRKLPAPVRSTLDSLTESPRGRTLARFKRVQGAIVDDEIQKVGPNQLPKVKHVDLLFQSVLVEESNDDSIFTAATDTVHLAVVAINDIGKVTPFYTKFGSIKEGTTKKDPDKTIGTVDIEGTDGVFPRAVSFQVTAIEKDSGGTYNDFMDEASEYLQEKVTDELIAAGIVAAGGAIGVTVPAPVALYIAGYVESWVDDLIEWFFDLFENNDDIIGERTKSVTLPDLEFEIHERRWPIFTNTIQGDGKGTPLKGSTFYWTFAGSGARWKTEMNIQLR